MTKYLILKSFLALFILSSFSCAKKDPKKVAPKSEINMTKTSKTSSADKSVAASQSTDVSIAQKSSADTSVASTSSEDNSKANSADVTLGAQSGSQDNTNGQVIFPTIQKAPVKLPVAQNASMDLTKKQSPVVSTQISTDATVQKKSQEPEISEAEKTAILKVKVLNQKLIEEIFNKANKVVFNSKVSDSSEALKVLKNGNEDSFCGLTGEVSFVDQKMIAITAIDKKLVDKTSDVYETEMTLMSQNKKSSLKCLHTTSQFFIEQFVINMSEYFEVWNDTKKVETADFKNPRTLNRYLNAVKIKNLKILQDAGALDHRKALVSGRLVSEEESLDLLRSEKERAACVVSEMSKDLDLSKVYIRVDKMMGPDKYKEVIEQQTIYRADKDNYFVFQCMMNKKNSNWYDLMNVAKDVLEFGVMNRNEYNKTYDQVKALNEKLKSEN